uniref:3-beta hydroxysteroid dehydrogenase/isomerase domain-containing protein n=1 Tax=Ditylenchus dipsaci TaxID=166011 RepID=A0A915CL31_9BILA
MIEQPMTVDRSKTKVLVTGASGYVALHCVKQLLDAGYFVRGTVRSLKNAAKVDPLRKMEGADERLELVEADLVENVKQWPNVIQGCEYVLHVASPWPIIADESTIKVAVDGTLNVLKAASKCHSPSVKKIVLTSSCAAINDGHKNSERVFDETCWTNLNEEGDHPAVDNYAKSKTLAEKSAWDYWNSLDKRGRYQLTVLNPTFITGPVLSSVEHGSATIISRMMDIRTFLAVPKVCLGFVDVRDVARAHLLAMVSSKSDGQRILVTHDRPVWFNDVNNWLSKEFTSQGFVISPIVTPNWLLKLYAKTNIDPKSSAVVHRLGGELRFSNKKSLELLEMGDYIDPQQSTIEMVYSMMEKRMVKKPPLGKLPFFNKKKTSKRAKQEAPTDKSEQNVV